MIHMINLFDDDELTSIRIRNGTSLDVLAGLKPSNSGQCQNQGHCWQ